MPASWADVVALPGSRYARPALERAKVSSDDLLLMAAGPADGTSKLLGQLRLAVAKKENLLNAEAFEFLWVTDFPLLEYHAEDGRWYSMHHPFTAPAVDSIEDLRANARTAVSRGYDMVLNGNEIGGGSMTNESDPDEKAAELRGALP